MVKIEILQGFYNPKTFAKGTGHDTIIRLAFAEKKGEPVMIFGEESNPSYVFLSDLKKAIDEELKEYNKRANGRQLIGYIKRPISIKGKPIIPEGQPVYGSSDRYYVEVGETIQPFFRHSLADSIEFVDLRE